MFPSYLSVTILGSYSHGLPNMPYKWHMITIWNSLSIDGAHSLKAFHRQCNLIQHWTHLYSIRCQIVYKLNRAWVPSWALVGMCLRLTGPRTSFGLIHIWTSWNIQMDTLILTISPKPDTETIHWSKTIQKYVKVYQMDFITGKHITSLWAHSDTGISSIWWKQLWREVDNNPHWHLPQHHLLDWTICCTHNDTFVVVRTMNAIITILWPHRLMFFQNRSVLNKVTCLHRKNLVFWMLV